MRSLSRAEITPLRTPASRRAEKYVANDFCCSSVKERFRFCAPRLRERIARNRAIWGAVSSFRRGGRWGESLASRKGEMSPNYNTAHQRRTFSLAARFAIAIFSTAVLALLTLTSPAGHERALAADEQTFVALINDYRSANGLGPVGYSATLTNAAVWMAQDMATNNYFSHKDSLGRDPFQRMTDFGYPSNVWRGENLAGGPDDPGTVLNLWISSPGHNAVLLNANYVAVGIGRAYVAGTTYGWYWAADFGGAGAPPPPPPSPEPPPPEPPAPPPPPPTTGGFTPPALKPAPSANLTAEPIAEPKSIPEPEPPPIPNWQAIFAQALPWWNAVSLIDAGEPLLSALAFMAEKHLSPASQ